MRNLLAKIGGKLMILEFKIKTKMLVSRLINVTCKTPTFEALFAEVDKDYQKVIKRSKSSIYTDLIICIHDDFLPCLMEEEMGESEE